MMYHTIAVVSAQGTVLEVKIDKFNEFGGGNIADRQVLRSKSYDLEKEVYYIGKLSPTRIQSITGESAVVWRVNEVVSSNIWDYREEAEIALMTGRYESIDWKNEDEE